MTDAFAYSFTCDLTPAEIVERFRRAAGWPWLERDNDNWGPYYSASVLPDPHRGMVKLIAEPDHYVINVVLRSDASAVGTLFEDVRDTIVDKLLPAIGAKNIHDTELYE